MRSSRNTRTGNRATSRTDPPATTGPIWTRNTFEIACEPSKVACATNLVPRNGRLGSLRATGSSNRKRRPVLLAPGPSPDRMPTAEADRGSRWFLSPVRITVCSAPQSAPTALRGSPAVHPHRDRFVRSVGPSGVGPSGCAYPVTRPGRHRLQVSLPPGWDRYSKASCPAKACDHSARCS